MTIKVFFSGLFISVGILILLLSSGCTLYFTFTTAPSEYNLLGNFVIASMVGGIPFLIGLFLFLIGRAMKNDELHINK